jgi:hypothetical protein
MASVRSGLATVARGLGYTTYSTLPGHPELPAIIVNSQDLIEYHQTLDGLSKITLPLTILVPSSDMESAQRTLDELVSYKPESLVQVLEAHESDIWSALVVVRAGPQFRTEIGANAVAYGVDLTLQLHA